MVGGSGVGESHVRRVLDAVPTVRRAVDDLRFVVVRAPASTLAGSRAQGRHDPDALATAIVEELDREIDYRPVEAGGAARAAGLLAELL